MAIKSAYLKHKGKIVEVDNERRILCVEWKERGGKESEWISFNTYIGYGPMVGMEGWVQHHEHRDYHVLSFTPFNRS